MDKPISVGDLAVAIRGCPFCNYRAGKVIRVLRLGPPRNGGYFCSGCGRNEFDLGITAAFYKADHGLPITWLKRIPPLEELDGEKRDEKLTEPA